jgi:hypothetical protein
MIVQKIASIDELLPPPQYTTTMVRMGIF